MTYGVLRAHPPAPKGSMWIRSCCRKGSLVMLNLPQQCARSAGKASGYREREKKIYTAVDS
jgi:hypothetical protein